MQGSEDDGAREVPAAVLVVQAVVRIAGEDLRRGRRVCVPGVVAIADEAVGEGGVQPCLVRRGVGVEGEIVGVAQVLQVGRRTSKGVSLGAPAVEDEERAPGVVGAVVQVGNEEAAVGRGGEEARAVQATKGDIDAESAGKREGDALCRRERERVWGEGRLLGGSCAGEQQERDEETHCFLDV